MTLLSERLKELRLSAGLNQSEFAEIGGVTRVSQVNYEKGLRSPDANYLERLSKAGIDVLYLLTGVPTDRRPDDLTVDEFQLLKGFQNASDSVKEALLHLVRAVNEK